MEYVENEKVIAAARRNSKKSTGPRDTSVTRFNRLDHGLYARKPVNVDEMNDEHRMMYEWLREYYGIEEGNLDPLVSMLLLSSSFHINRLMTGYRKLLERGEETRNRSLFFQYGNQDGNDADTWHTLVMTLMRHERGCFSALRELKEMMQKGGDK